MSTASDLLAYDRSVEPVSGDVLFKDKKWTYIQDSTSNNGSYSGQIQFNLSTISSQSAFVNWQEAVIQLPVKLQILNGGASAVTMAAGTGPSFDQLIPKAGAWHFIDSVMVVVDGVTVQTNQIHENVNAQFKAITEWDYNYYRKNGPTSLFALDDFEPMNTSTAQVLDNVTTSEFINTNYGEFGLSNTVNNVGARERIAMTAVDSSGSGTSQKLAYNVMGGTANVQSTAKSQVWTSTSASGYTVQPGYPFYVAHFLATIKLADICDYFKKCPMQKNTRGFIYINYNASTTTMTVDASAGTPTTVQPAKVTSLLTNMNYGQTCPILWNFASANLANSASSSSGTGLTFPASTGTVTLSITADINGTATANTISAPQQFSRLLVPTYTPNPTADHALVQKKTFRYFERITNKFTVNPNQSFTVTITNGMANPKKIFLQPVITNPTALSTIPDVINPLRSPLSTVPATTSPFASLKNLQLTVGNIPIWNNPVSFGYDLFVQEMSKSGVDGGLDSTTDCGLLSQQLWESLYRFVAVDIGRRLPSEDGAQKSIVISGVSNCAYPLTVYYHVWRETVCTLDTAMGTISQGAVQPSS